MLDDALKATLLAQVGDTALAQTLDASPTATIKPAARPESDTRPGPDPDRLPRLAGGGDFELGAVLGEGGMGRVHVARQQSLGREVAVKMLREDASPATATALLREAVVTGGLEHPGIVPVHALGLDARGAPMLVMKRVEGVDWRALIHDPDHPAWAGRLGDRVVAHLEILVQLCRTVEFAHKRDVLHRDIKPENVMLGDFGEVYLIDWGIAWRLDPSSQARAAGFAGTPAYMAPEMLSGDLDVRSDVFLLGACLHEALTTRHRNSGTTMEGVLAAALSPARYDYDASVPAELGEICNRATARDPAERFATVEALRVAIAGYLQHRGSIALAERAAARTAALAGMLEAAGDGAPGDLQRAYQAANEARFGLTEALHAWPDNAEARRQLAACLSLAVELELRQGHVAAAEAWMSELDDPPEALRRRLERARSDQAAAEAEHARLRSLRADLDATVAVRPQAIGLVILMISSAAALGFFQVRYNYTTMSPELMLWVALGFLAFATGMTGVFHKKLLQNAFNRRATGTLLTVLAALAASRAVGVVERASVSRIVAQDLLVLGACAAAGAVMLLRWLAVMVPIVIACLVVTLADASRSVRALSLTLLAFPPVIAFALWRHRREQARAGQVTETRGPLAARQSTGHGSGGSAGV